MSITVYTKPNCIQCEQTKSILDQNNIIYNVVDLTENDEAKNMVLSMGFRSAPVVITKNDRWSGFKIEKLKSLIMNNG